MGLEKRTVRSALVIGAGSIGQRHAKNLKNLGINVTLFDTDGDILTRACSEGGYYSTEDLNYALCKQPFDLALVCTPTHLHIPIAQSVADAGVNLFIEKPLSHSWNGIEKLISTVKKNDLYATMGFMLRFEPGLKHLKNLIDPKDIAFAQVEGGSYMPAWRPGTDYRKTYCSNSSMGGGAILDGVHEIDYICWLLGYPDKIHGVSGKFSSLELDTEDTAMIIFEYSDKLVSLHMDYLQKKYTRRCKLCKRDGTVYEWTFGNSVREHTGGVERILCQYDDTFETNELYMDELVRVLLNITQGVQPTSTLENGAKVLDIALKARYGGGKW
jgi:predicted dehydrogenase